MVAYFKIDGVPGRYFECVGGFGSISDKACARNFTESMTHKARKVGRLSRCDGCPIGGKHSGVPVVTKPRNGAGLVCARCEKQCRRLISGSICVSCYNRQREVLIGRNSKGTAPVRCRPISGETLTIVSDWVIKVRSFGMVCPGSGESMRMVVATEKQPVLVVQTVLPLVWELPRTRQVSSVAK